MEITDRKTLLQELIITVHDLARSCPDPEASLVLRQCADHINELARDRDVDARITG